MSKQTVCTKGWNWGKYELTDQGIDFKVDDKPCFTINYKNIALSNSPFPNEVALEFVGEQE